VGACTLYVAAVTFNVVRGVVAEHLHSEGGRQSQRRTADAKARALLEWQSQRQCLQLRTYCICSVFVSTLAGCRRPAKAAINLRELGLRFDTGWVSRRPARAAINLRTHWLCQLSLGQGHHKRNLSRTRQNPVAAAIA
jgi:hypothetical protein